MLEGACCPACRKPHRLRPVATGAGEVEVYRCDRCRGVLATRESASQAASNEPTQAVMHSANACRRCGAVARLEALHCPTCAMPLGIQCPLCWSTMDVVLAGRVVVDVCRRCEFLFFDEGELVEAFRDPTQLAAPPGPKWDGRSGVPPEVRPEPAARAERAEAGDVDDVDDPADSATLAVAALGAAGIGGKLALGVSAATVVAASTLGRAVLQLLTTVFR